MTGSTGWSQVDSWASFSLSALLRPLSVMPITASLGGVYWSGGWWHRVLVGLYGVVGAYVGITVMLYVLMRLAGRSLTRREVDSADVPDLARAVGTFGLAIGIPDSGWRYFLSELGVLGVATMPETDGRLVFMASGTKASTDSFEFAFTGLRNGRRFEVHSEAVPFPQRGVDTHFDTSLDSKGLFGLACELADSGGVLDIDELDLTKPVQNPIKTAGLFRFGRTWGVSCWRRRGVVRGFGSE